MSALHGGFCRCSLSKELWSVRRLKFGSEVTLFVNGREVERVGVIASTKECRVLSGHSDSEYLLSALAHVLNGSSRPFLPVLLCFDRKLDDHITLEQSRRAQPQAVACLFILLDSWRPKSKSCVRVVAC